MKKVLKITEWKLAKLMFHGDRRKIINSCSIVPQSIKELSVMLQLNPGSVFNHVKQLETAGYLEVVERRLVNGIEEKKYLRTAEFFDLSEIRKKDLDVRNKYIVKDFGKYVLEILVKDELGPVQHIDVLLSQEKYDEALRQYRTLVKFLSDNNGSGQMRASYVGALGVFLPGELQK